MGGTREVQEEEERKKGWWHGREPLRREKGEGQDRQCRRGGRRLSGTDEEAMRPMRWGGEEATRRASTERRTRKRSDEEAVWRGGEEARGGSVEGGREAEGCGAACGSAALPSAARSTHG